MGNPPTRRLAVRNGADGLEIREFAGTAQDRQKPILRRELAGGLAYASAKLMDARSNVDAGLKPRRYAGHWPE